jgi:N-acetylmuramoyl-L-alanine amidase
LLARVVHGEARGESYTGKVAVAAVVINRIKSPQFPNTLTEVVYQPGAFTCITDGQVNLKPNHDSYRAAFDAILGNDPTGGCVFYLNPKTATSRWMHKRISADSATVIGNHVFMK